MHPTPIYVTLHALIPAVFILLGGFIGLIFSIKSTLKSIIQHFVAGIVLAAVAVDLLPKILNTGSTFTIAIGFIIGAVLMLLLMWLTERLEKNVTAEQASSYLGAVIAVAIDIFIDGFLIGISFIAGRESGLLVSVALATCAFFLAISIAMILKDRNVVIKKRIAWIILLAILMPLGAFIGSSVVTHLPESWLTEMLAFGVAALLYLAVEELVLEAHEEQTDTPWITAPFFLGFLAVLLLK